MKTKNTPELTKKYIQHDLVLNSNGLLNKELEGKPPCWQISV